MMTIEMIRIAALSSRFIKLSTNNYSFGVNSRAVFIGVNKDYKGHIMTDYISWSPISFSEYIRIKSGFYGRV